MSLAFRTLATGATLVGALALAGCGGGDSSGAPPTSPSVTSSASARSTEAAVASTDSLVSAAKLVLDRVSGSTLLSIETDRRGWQVQVATGDGTGSQAVVNAAGTEIVSGPTSGDDDRDDRSDDARLVAGATVDYAVAARTIAHTIARGTPGSITGLDLDDYRGQVVWEGEDDSRPRVTVRVNAGDGRVVSTDTESPDSDD